MSYKEFKIIYSDTNQDEFLHDWDYVVLTIRDEALDAFKTGKDKKVMFILEAAFTNLLIQLGSQSTSETTSE